MGRPESIGKFIKYYKEYEFLKPPVIGYLIRASPDAGTVRCPQLTCAAAARTHGKEKSDPEEKRAQVPFARACDAFAMNQSPWWRARG